MNSAAVFFTNGEITIANRYYQCTNDMTEEDIRKKIIPKVTGGVFNDKIVILVIIEQVAFHWPDNISIEIKKIDGQTLFFEAIVPNVEGVTTELVRGS